MSDLPLEELVLRCQRALPGDTRAFEALVALFKRRVFTTAYRIMGSREEAEDQAQEVFVKIYRGIAKLEEPAALPAWVQRVTVHTCLDALGRQKRRPAYIPITDGGEGGRDYASPRSSRPDAAAEARELRRCLGRALSGLEPQGRQVIVLRDVEDLPYEEVAAALGVGLSAAKMRIHRARLAFQKSLEEVCPGVAARRGV